MASSQKTPLGFNKWIGTDMPQMADFNADNDLSDTKFSNVWNKSNLIVDSGTWTPILKGDITAGNFSYTAQSGHYIKIANLTHIYFSLSFSNALNSGATGNLIISGSPSIPAYAAAGTFYYSSGVFNLENYGIFPLIISSGDIRLYRTHPSSSQLSVTQFATNSAVSMSGVLIYKAV